MKTIGIRASTQEVTFAIFDTDSNTIINIETIKIPKALSTPDSLKYVRNSILDILREYDIQSAGIRVTESSAQSLNISRISIEAVIQESFASSELSSYYCGQISNISSKVGIERDQFKPMVEGTVNYDAVQNWNSMTKEKREAIFTAIGAKNV